MYFYLLLSAKAEIGGVLGALHAFDGSGTETTRSSGEKIMEATKKMLVVPEVFVEAIVIMELLLECHSYLKEK